MPGDMTLNAAQLAEAITHADFSGCAATVVGYGYMGRQYVKALGALGVRRIRVCSRSAGPLEELCSTDDVELVGGGFERLDVHPRADELGIVATPTALLVPAAQRLASLGFPRLLIEKPVALYSSEIEKLAEMLVQQGIEALCAYNRMAYPALHEALSRAQREGGISSCTYTFTEVIKSDWAERFPPDELARWGIANSMHVISMAHRLIGLPVTWNGYQSGALPWHPTGAVFVGSGISEQGVPFSYHADWGSTGRWSVEIHTPVSSYRLCPLEEICRRTSNFGDWEMVTVAAFAPDVKAGIVEQLAYSLGQLKRAAKVLPSLLEAAALTRYGEQIFGY